MNRPDDDDDDDDDYEQDTDGQENTDKKNIFSSATDAVMSVVKRAAQILGTKSNEAAQNTKNSTVSTLISTCSSPRHLVSCDKCSETLFGQVKFSLEVYLCFFSDLLDNLLTSCSRKFRKAK